MGNNKSTHKVVEVVKNDCNVGKLTCYNDAKEIELLRNTLPNHFTGYEQCMSLKISDYIKYENGLYLYISRSILMRYLFDMEICSMIQNFKVQNEDVKMYIQTDMKLPDGKKKVDLYETENFIVRDDSSCHLTFAFVSKRIITEEFTIIAEKMLSGPESFTKSLNDKKMHIKVKNGEQLDAKKVSFFNMIEKQNPNHQA